MSKKTKILLIIIIVLLGTVAVLWTILKCPTKEEASVSETEQKQLPEEIYSFSGTITAVQENAIMINTTIIFTDGTTATEPKRVLINENTTITKLEFPKVAPEDRGKPIKPVETELGFSDLQEGNRVDIRSSENISGKTEFQAESINVVK